MCTVAAWGCAVGRGVLAAVLSELAYFRWRDNEIAMRRSRRVSAFAIGAAVVVTLVACATRLASILMHT